MVSIITTRAERRKAYGKIVGERAVRRNRALDNSRRSIMNLVAVLAKSVPMKTRRLIPQIVVYMSYEPIAFCNVHLRWRELAINANHRP